MGEGQHQKRWLNKPWLICLGVLLLVLVLLVVVGVVLLKHTSIAHTFLLTTIWRDFSINRTLPDGQSWDLSNPSIYGLPNNTRNLKIPVSGGHIGAWYMEPEGRVENDKPAVLYLHGIAQTRGYQHRVGLYEKLLGMGHQVLAIDYRGFADSTDLEDITETTVVEDAAASLRYLREELGAKKVLVWGHSQGAAVAVHMVAQEEDAGVGLLLESPYNSLDAQIRAILPWHLRVIVLNLVGLKSIGLEFLSGKWAAEVSWPILILHAEDDPKIPQQLSEQILEETKGKSNPISRILFSKDFGFRHNDIYTFPHLQELVTKFEANAIDTKGSTLICTPENMDSYLD